MRDLKGYGGRPPEVRWPADAKVAVSFVVNFEEGAEFSVAEGDARNESVEKCSDCHFPEGLESKGKSKIDLKIAYHGNSDNSTNNAGCIECHKRYYDKNPDKERKGPTSKCAECHQEKQSLLAPPRSPRTRWLAEQWVALLGESRQIARAR